jgi:hypothetical protein
MAEPETLDPYLDTLHAVEHAVSNVQQQFPGGMMGTLRARLHNGRSGLTRAPQPRPGPTP